MSMSIDYRHIHGAAMVSKSGSTTTNLRLPPGFMGRHIVLLRQVWEHAAIQSMSYSGVRIPCAMRQVGEEKVVDLPVSDSDRSRVLSIDWTNLGNRALHLHYVVTEEPREGALPEAERAPSAELTQRLPVDTTPPTELEEAIALSFRVTPDRLRLIVTKLAEGSGLERTALLDYFGHDGYTTILPDTIEAITKRAQELELDPAELLVAHTFRGVAQAVGEKSEFDRLMADSGGSGGLARPAEGASRPAPDFKVSSVLAPAVPSTEVATAAGVPHVIDGARMNELAKWLGVSPMWLVSAVKTVADLKGHHPADLVDFMTWPMVVALRQMFFGAVSAPDEPTSAAVREAASGNQSEERIRFLNERIAARSIDSVAAAKRVAE